MTVSGFFSSDTSSDGSGCDLYSDPEGTFEFAGGFSPDEELSVYVAGNEPGVVFAGVAEELADVEGFASVFEDATGSGAALELVESELVFAEASEEEGDASEAAEADDGDASAALSELAERGDDDGDDASGPAAAIGSFLEALSGGGEDDGEDGSSLSASSDGSTWTVTDSSGSTVGSYDSFDDAESAVEDGGTITLNEDLGATYAEDGTVTDTSTAVTFDGKDSGSYTIDLAGHMLGEIVFKCAADLTITSSKDGGGLDGASTAYGVYAYSSGDVTVQNISITNARGSDSTMFYGMYVYSISSATIANVSVESVAAGGTSYTKGSYGLYAYKVDSLTLENCTFAANTASSSTNGCAYGVYLRTTTATVDGCVVSSEHDSSKYAYGLDIDSNAVVTTSDCTFSATAGSGTAYGCYSANALEAENCGFTASSDTGDGYGLYVGSSASVSLGAGNALSGTTASMSLYAAVSLLSGFSAESELTVYCNYSLTDAVFAYLADDLDGDAIAKMFTASSESYYAGCTAVASDGSLVWSSDAEAESVDLYGVLTSEGVALSEDVELEFGKDYYLSQSVDGYSGQIQMTGDGTYNIDLRGNTITFGSGGFYIYGTGGTDSVNIYSTNGEGAAKQGYIAEGYIYLGGSKGSSELSLENINLSISKNTIVAYTGYTPMKAEGYAQSLAVANCNIDVDYSGTSSSSYSAVFGLRANTSILSSVSFSDTTIDVKSDSSCDAIGVYMDTKTCATTFEDCSISAESAKGTATAVYNDKYYSQYNADITFSGTTKLAATGASGASFGILNIQGKLGNSDGISTNAGRAVTLNGPVSFSSESSSNVAALASEVQYTDSSASTYAPPSSSAHRSRPKRARSPSRLASTTMTASTARTISTAAGNRCSDPTYWTRLRRRPTKPAPTSRPSRTGWTRPHRRR